MSDNDAKWSCEYCTYENYPSSIKCTMCRGPKPFVSEDIYRLHGSDEKLTAGPCDNKNKRKWTCDNCSTSNSSKEHICQNCGATQSLALNLPEHMQLLKINTQQPSDLAQSLSRVRNTTNTSPPSVANLENSRRSQGKWICVVSSYNLLIIISTLFFNVENKFTFPSLEFKTG